MPFGKKELVEAFAPIFIQDMAASYDRLGEVRWKNHRIEVNPEKPTVYYYFSPCPPERGTHPSNQLCDLVFRTGRRPASVY